MGLGVSSEDRLALIETALGRREADLVIEGARIYNPYLGKFLPGSLAVARGRIAAAGEGFSGKAKIDARSGCLIAGFIDSHVHIESSMASPVEFARALCAAGVSAVVADPHEIANVAGLKGLEWLMEETVGLPVDVFVMAPSCVPATGFERGGAVLSADDILALKKYPRVLGLAEVMNFPAVLAGGIEVLSKMEGMRLIDGHAPGLSGKELSAYAAAGPRTDHECLEPSEALERIAAGQRALLREGTAAKNLVKLIAGLTEELSRFCHLCTDDRHAGDLSGQGSINHLVSLALETGSLPVHSVLNMATLNPAEHYGLRDAGSLAPGRVADMALYPDLKSLRPSHVWKGGELVAENGKPVWKAARKAPGSALRNSVSLAPLTPESLQIEAKGTRARVIGLVPGQIVTLDLALTLKTSSGRFLPDEKLGIAKLAVWERYGSKTPPAVGLIKDLGLARGAIGTTVSHDSHNLVVAGQSDADMLLCAKTIAEMEGGLALVLNGEVLGKLPLPLGGLMSEMTMEDVSKAIGSLVSLAPELGFEKGIDPFMTLSFMSLPVIPSLKLTAGGLVDVIAFKVVPVSIERASVETVSAEQAWLAPASLAPISQEAKKKSKGREPSGNSSSGRQSSGNRSPETKSTKSSEIKEPSSKPPAKSSNKSSNKTSAKTSIKSSGGTS